MRDNIELQKADGRAEPNLRASVQRNRIFTNACRLPIETGDLIVRKLSTGLRETFRVTDPGFKEAFHGIPAHYQMTVVRVEEQNLMDDEISEDRKQRLFQQWEEYGLDIIKQDMANGGFRYVGGPPATRKLAFKWIQLKEAEREHERRTVHVSGPNARVNICSTDQSMNIAVGGDVIGLIRETLDRGIQDPSEKMRLNGLLDRLEAAKDKKSFLETYQTLIATTADHMTVLGPFLPALTHLLNGLGS
jgi:hypothetical protein